MADQADSLTVFRSADDTAEDDCRAIVELLTAQSLHPQLLDDRAAGVPQGVWEVQVPATEAAQAETLVASARLPARDVIEVDNSSSLDIETVFTASGGTTQELEASAVSGVLDAAGIASVTIGDSVLPNLSFEVRVAREDAQRARDLIAEAQAAGPAAADEASQEAERPPEGA
jgi:hypothetical protein